MLLSFPTPPYQELDCIKCMVNMADKRIVDYLKDGMKNGFSLFKLKDVLLQKGWNEAEINEAMAIVLGQTKKADMDEIRDAGGFSEALHGGKNAAIKHKISGKGKKPSHTVKKARSEKIRQDKHATQKGEKRQRIRHAVAESDGEFIKTGIKGLDSLMEKGIPKNKSILIAGGAGSGKTIMGLQILANAAGLGKKCLYMSFEESESSLVHHMNDFGWKPLELIKNGHLMIKRFSVFDIGRTLDALMAKSQGELLIDVKPIILPDNFKPDIVIVDSLTAIASAFSARETYRSYIEHLFHYFEDIGTTSFLITETDQVPTRFSPTGVEEFLADGVIVLYNIRKGDTRENAIEILKMRGARHLKKVVAMQILSDKGIEVYPEQEVFGGLK